MIKHQRETSRAMHMCVLLSASYTSFVASLPPEMRLIPLVSATRRQLAEQTRVTH
jgi:hypothetical protein